MEKTIREWFELLPTDIREKAIANSYHKTIDIMEPSLADALMFAFTWNETIEGADYWDKIHDKAVNGEFK